MMRRKNSVFILARKEKGSAGHGEPPNEFWSIMSIAKEPYEAGGIGPVFATSQGAKMWQENCDVNKYYEIVEVEIY
jgi:hypothetical protein